MRYRYLGLTIQIHIGRSRLFDSHANAIILHELLQMQSCPIFGLLVLLFYYSVRIWVQRKSRGALSQRWTYSLCAGLILSTLDLAQ